MTKRLILALLATLFTANVSAEHYDYPTNKDGSIVTGVLWADFNPAAGVAPIPGNLFFLGTDDFTLNAPLGGADPTDYSNPLAALNTIDGFSTTEKWVATFSAEPYALDTSSIVAGQNVRMFEVSTIFGTIVAVSGIVRELTANVDYVARASGSTLAIIPLKPLKEMTTYMAVLTNGIKDTKGNDSTPDQTYYLSKRADPWIDEDGHSTYSLVDDATATTLESLRQMTAGHENAAESVGIAKEDIILSWTAQTQSITPVLKNLRSMAKPAPTVLVPTGMDTSAVGGLGIADVYAGTITIPYYLGVPSAENPVAPLVDFWTAAPGAYVPPFDALGLNPNSTHITVANPIPVVTSMQTVPLLMAVPNANSGQVKPAAGWPVLIYGHGLGGNRSHLLSVADSAASAGYAVIAIDAPLHGLGPDEPLYAGSIPGVNERTFDVDYVNNETGAPGPDGIPDASGTHMINLGSMLTSRDNSRQGSADLSILAVSIPHISYDGDMLPDLDGSTIQYASISMGSILGTAFMAVEPTVTNAFLSVPMGGLARGLEASPTFGPGIQAGLEAAAGLVPGTPEYEQFFLVFQSVLDSGDPINWSKEAALYNNIILHEVIGDQVLPNYVLTAPLSGTEPMIATMGLPAYSTTQFNPAGLDLAGRFLPPAHHGSFATPAGAPEVYFEMQKQMATFIGSKGTTVVVTDESTMVTAVAVTNAPVSDLSEKKGSKSKAKKKPSAPVNRVDMERASEGSANQINRLD